MAQIKLPFHVMTKPIGPICNLACEYCFYLDKDGLYPNEKNFRMSDELLEEYIKQYIACQPGPVVPFAWQGGEPTLMGLEFFQKAVELQKKYLPEGWHAENAFQTNGILLDEAWCDFFRENSFLVGISIDGPAHLHDVYRKDRGGQSTHARVLKSMHLMKERQVEFNILCVVNNVNSQYPKEVYRFFRDEGAQFIQFIPIVEHLGGGKVSARTVDPQQFGRFLIGVFNEWVTHDIGRVFVQTFEECASVWAGLGARLCVFTEVCGRAMAMEHNGDVYSCDHYVFPEYKLGNMLEVPLSEIVESPFQKKFGRDKTDALPTYCRECDVRFICNGACPKDRFAFTPDGEPGLNYLCQGYKQFFHYVDPYMRALVEAIRRRLPPAKMRAQMMAVHKRIWDVGRNDPCPCGSGKKYKKCCMGMEDVVA